MSDAATIDAAAPAAAPASAPAAAPAASAPAAAPAASPTAAPAPEAKQTEALTLPGKDAKPEQWKEFYKSIGAPESGDAYALPVPEGGNAEFAKEAAAMMAEAGLLPHQAKALAEWWNSKSAGALKASQDAAATAAADAGKQAEADDVALRKEWAGDTYEKNVEDAKRAVRQFVPQGKTEAFLDGIQKVLGYGDTMRFMANIGKKLAEGSANGLDGAQGAVTTKTLEQRLYSKP